MIKNISSAQNPYIKTLIQLKDKSKNRKQSGLFLIEGLREINLALKSDYPIETLLFDPKLISQNQIENLVSNKAISIENIISINNAIYQKLAHRDTTEGIIGLAKSKDHGLNLLKFKSDTPLILVAEALEKPGNIGALLRTADAANIDAVIIANPKSDLYNPNCIRSSVGCVFTNQIGVGTTKEVIEYLKKNHYNIYCAALGSDSKPYYNQDFKKSTALIVGTESTGLTQEWLKNSTQNIIIPMQGKIDSMNVSVSAAILIFEAKRQRNFI